MAPPNTKGVKVIDALNKNPDLENHQIAKQVGCTSTYVKRIRAKMAHVDEPDITQEELDEVLETASILSPSTLDEVLDERGSRYGSFVKHAFITQRLKAVMSDTPNWIKLDDDMVESLEMVAHKIGRILNGDPTYADSWVDIAGYAQLVADRLQGKER